MNTLAPLVSVIDDDESVRESLPDLLKIFGFSSQTFASALDFLATKSFDKTSCLILDVAMPGMSGPELSRELRNLGYTIPTIFITGQVDAASRAAIPADAVACLTKPFTDTALLDALRMALNMNNA